MIDGSSGLWCVNAGHGRPEIAAAVSQQLLTLDYAPSFQMSHPLVFDLATELARREAPAPSRIFFTNSGSEAGGYGAEDRARPSPRRGPGARGPGSIGREKGYHGVGSRRHCRWAGWSAIAGRS